MLAVKDALGDHFSMNIDILYQKCIVFILKNLVVGFHQAREEESKPKIADKQWYAYYIHEYITLVWQKK